MTAQAIIATSYTDVTRLLDDTVNKFVCRYGGEFDEYRSIANELFMEARKRWHDHYDRFGYHRSSFTNWLRYFVWKQLLERVRTAATRNNRLPRVYDYPLEEAAECRSGVFCLDDYELSPRAKQVASMVFQPPIDIRDAMRSSGRDMITASPTQIRKYIRLYLKELGWPAQTIAETFEEIGVAVS